MPKITELENIMDVVKTKKSSSFKPTKGNMLLGLIVVIGVLLYFAVAKNGVVSVEREKPD